jgi:hypothetical protein
MKPTHRAKAYDDARDAGKARSGVNRAKRIARPSPADRAHARTKKAQPGERRNVGPIVLPAT